MDWEAALNSASEISNADEKGTKADRDKLLPRGKTAQFVRAVNDRKFGVIVL